MYASDYIHASLTKIKPHPYTVTFMFFHLSISWAQPGLLAVVINSAAILGLFITIQLLSWQFCTEWKGRVVFDGWGHTAIPRAKQEVEIIYVPIHRIVPKCFRDVSNGLRSNGWEGHSMWFTSFSFWTKHSVTTNRWDHSHPGIDHSWQDGNISLYDQADHPGQLYTDL